MANRTIRISEEAYAVLVQRKTADDDSFTKVILRHFRPPADTCGDVLERIEQAPPPPFNAERMKTHLKQRGRRSRR